MQAREVQQQTSFSAFVSFAESLPFTPRAAKQLLHMLAAPNSSSNSSSSNWNQDESEQQEQQHLQQQHEGAAASIDVEDSLLACGCWSPLDNPRGGAPPFIQRGGAPLISQSKGGAPTEDVGPPGPVKELFGVGPPIVKPGKGRGPPW